MCINNQKGCSLRAFLLTRACESRGDSADRPKSVMSYYRNHGAPTTESQEGKVITRISVGTSGSSRSPICHLFLSRIT